MNSPEEIANKLFGRLRRGLPPPPDLAQSEWNAIVERMYDDRGRRREPLDEDDE
ncbi:hypothetical protein ACIPRI_14695 [Variovorax sp. LARHSF232]